MKKKILLTILMGIIAVCAIVEQDESDGETPESYCVPTVDFGDILTIELTMNAPESYMEISYAGYIVIGDSILTISMIDGSVTYKDSTNLDEAARLFWKAIKTILQEEKYDIGMWVAGKDSVITCPDCKARIKVWRY